MLCANSARDDGLTVGPATAARHAYYLSLTKMFPSFRRPSQHIIFVCVLYRNMKSSQLYENADCRIEDTTGRGKMLLTGGGTSSAKKFGSCKNDLPKTRFEPSIV